MVISHRTNMKTSSGEDPHMETRVLLPSELSLIVTPPPLPPLDQLVPREDSIKVCATRTIRVGETLLPMVGTVRSDRLPLIPYLSIDDARNSYGAFDTVSEHGRICNWVRFLRVREQKDEVNIIARQVLETVIFEVVKEVETGGELVVYLTPDGERLPYVKLLSSFNIRQSFNTFMADKPLDLSLSLVTETPTNQAKMMRFSPKVERKRQSSSTSSDTEEHSDVSPSSSPISSAPSSPMYSSTISSTSTSPLHQFLPTTPSFFATSNPFVPRFPCFFPTEFNFAANLPRMMERNHELTQSPMSSPERDSNNNRRVSSPIINSIPPKRRERTMLPCHECGKPFDRPSLLKRHVRTHTGEKPHGCDVCGKGFSTSSSLNTHRRIHSGEKPHQCLVCGKRFTASSNLYYHKLTHSKDKPHKCSICPRSFPTPGDLRSHMFVHTGQYPHKCEVCGKGFSKMNNLRNHTLLHSNKTRVASQTDPSSTYVSEK